MQHNKQKENGNFAERFFLILTLIFLLAGGLRTILWPKEINTYENRSANKVMDLTLSAYSEKAFQDSLETALMDQVPFSEGYKTLYNRAKTRLLLAQIGLMEDKSAPMHYIRFARHYLFGEHIVYGPISIGSVAEGYDKNIEAINRTMAKHKDVEFFFYFIETDHDMNFEAGSKTGLYAYIKERLNTDEAHIGCFSINSFEEFDEYFYETDHHWNHKGAYRGYLGLTRLLGIKENILAPTEEVILKQHLSGSKARVCGAQGILTEEFGAYRFAQNELIITVNKTRSDYGREEEFITGSTTDGVQYGSFYGWDRGETILDTGEKEKENILILGDSFDNALLKLIAGHFNKTYSVDLRNYEKDMGRPFVFEEYIKENEIDKVLVMGYENFFRNDAFIF